MKYCEIVIFSLVVADILSSNIRSCGYHKMRWCSSKRKKKNLSSFINTKKAFKKLYMLYFETLGLFLIHLQSTNKK